MKKLAPLRGIQAFEAVGRTGSVTAAAKELDVSPGAVSQQIRALENHLKLRLVQRSGRGVELTTWGSVYLRRVSAGIEQFQMAKDDIERLRRSNDLIISALPSLAISFVGPMMFEWKRQRSKVNVLIVGKDLEPRLDEGEADFRVSYGNRSRQHMRFAELFTDRVLPVASPSLLAARRIGNARDLLKFPLIWVDWGPEYLPPPTWRDWFASVGVTDEPLRCDMTFTLPTGAIYAAIDGRGIALAQYSMASSAIAGGALVPVLSTELLLSEKHFLAWNSAALEKPAGQAFRDWFIRVARRHESRPTHDEGTPQA